MQTGIFYDSVNAHQLRLIEYRPDGKALYDDLKSGCRVLCSPEDVCQYPGLGLPPVMKAKSLTEEEMIEFVEKWSKPSPDQILKYVEDIT